MSRKIPFDIIFRPQIESGKYKVETRDGHEARIICWDASEDEPIVAVVSGLVHQYTLHGYANYLKDNDLFIITPEEEPTESENISDERVAKMAVIYSTCCKVENGTRHAIMNWNTFKKVAQKFINIGKAEALKDLPKWRHAFTTYSVDKKRPKNPECAYYTPDDRAFIVILENSNEAKCILLDDLKKLPGFKENEI